MLTKNDVEIIKALLIAHAQATSNAGDIQVYTCPPFLCTDY